MKAQSRHIYAAVPWSIWESILNHAAEAKEDPHVWVEKMLVSAAKTPPRSWIRDKKFITIGSGHGDNKRLRLGPEAVEALKIGVEVMGGSMSRSLQVLYFTGLRDYAYKRLREHVASYTPKS